MIVPPTGYCWLRERFLNPKEAEPEPEDDWEGPKEAADEGKRGL